jgi:uncharacterized membrane protein
VGGVGFAQAGRIEFGIPDDFIQQVGAMIQPGGSAIYALLRTVHVVADQFRGHGGNPEHGVKAGSAEEGRQSF